MQLDHHAITSPEKRFLSAKILRVMRMTAFFLTVCCLHISASSLSQQVSLSLKNVPLERVFNEIRQQTGYNFVYNDDWLRQARKVSITAAKAPLATVLDICFQDQPFTYTIIQQTIALKPRQEEMGAAQVQDGFTVSGVVTNEIGEKLPGVTVMLKGTAIGTATTVDGKYTLLTQRANDTLVFSYVGYEKQELAVNGRAQVNVQLKAGARSMDEVVVVGMNNRQTKRSITGAVATIQTKELKQSPVANLSNALAGRLPGLITVQNSGEPGEDAAKLYIRGIGTYGNSAPLVVIDGLPRAQADFNQLDANEIESVSILKDATSSALYGIQGANGVIVVTTKRGASNQKPAINFTVQQAVQQPVRLPRMMDAYNQALYFKEADINGDQPQRYTDEVLQQIKDGSNPYLYPNVNWFDELLKKESLQSQYNLNVSGSTNMLRYFVSGSYVKQGTLLKYDDVFNDNYGVKSKFDRYNFRSNIDLDATSMLHLRVDLAGRLENRTGPGPGFGEVFSEITGRSPSALPVFNPDGTLGAGSGLEIPYHQNPYGMITKSGYYTNYTNVMYGTLSAKHDLDFITNGLSAQLFFSFENDNYKTTTRSQAFDSYWYKGQDGGDKPIYQKIGIASRLNTSGGSSIVRYNYLDLRLNYNRTFGAHTVSGQILGNRTLRVIDNELPYTYQGVSGHFTYNYKSKYFAEVNMGFNGSENFPKGRRYGVFPAFSAAWVLSEESFLKQTSWLDFLKIRMSHGIAGNDKIGGNRWLFISDFAPGGGFRFGTSPNGVPGYNENIVGNNYVTWERAAKSNAGIDVSFFRQGEVQFSFDLFRERRTNILTQPGTVPDIVGITGLAPRNSGIMQNRGFEAELRLNKTFGKVKVFANLQLTYARNKILENDRPAPAFPYQDLKGYEFGYELGYRAIGYFKDAADIAKSPAQNFSTVIPGDIKYEDVNNDGEINAFDRVPIQVQNVPRYVGGVSMGANYKGFDISLLLNGATGGSGSVVMYAGSLLQLQRWTPELGDNARVPVAHASGNNSVLSDLLIQKTDYLKLRNAEMGYELPANILRPFRIQYARIYVNGQNLLIWDSLWLKDRDPESFGNSVISYPLQRVMNIGVNVKF
jgi:TonB-linked SusC/RagA family outer membrane protein